MKRLLYILSIFASVAAVTACVDDNGRTEVFEIAAATFPHDDVANINAAAINLLHRDADGAAYYLERVKNQSPAWWDNLGIVFYLRGWRDRTR